VSNSSSPKFEHDAVVVQKCITLPCRAARAYAVHKLFSRTGNGR